MRHPSNTQRASARPAAVEAKAKASEASPAPPTQLNLDLGNWTPTPNLFFKWVNKLDLIEVRIVSLLVRTTFGWHRERCRFSVDEIMQHVDRSKPPVIDALARLRDKGILGRNRVSRQEPYEYWLVMRPEFRIVKRRAAPEHIQMPLRYDVHDFSSKETLTTGEVKKPLPLSGKETFTTEAPVLIIDLKKERSINTHTQIARQPAEEKTAASPRVCGSKFTRKQIRNYAWASHNFDQFLVEYYTNRNQKNRASIGIKNPEGWATAAKRSGEYDEEIQEWINDPSMFDCELFRTTANASNY